MKFKKQFYLLFICLWAGITKTTFAQQPATYDYVVSSNGKGNFTTIQEALWSFQTKCRSHHVPADKE
jgi:hypothetical protein